MKKLKVVALLLLCSSTAVMAKNVELSEGRYQQAKATLIKNNVMSDIANCALSQAATVERHRDDKYIQFKLLMALAKDCTNDNSFKLGLHPYEYLDFVRKLQQDGYSADYLESAAYKEKMEHLKNALPDTPALAAAPTKQDIRIDCDASCQTEFWQAQREAGAGLYAYALAINAGLNPVLGGEVNFYRTDAEHVERWSVPAFGSAVFFINEVERQVAP